LPGLRRLWNYFLRDLCPDFLPRQGAFVYTKAVVNATIHPAYGGFFGGLNKRRKMTLQAYKL